MSVSETQDAPVRGRPFEIGNRGRPRGARNKSTLAAEALLDGQVEAITQKLVDAALGGDMTAIKLVLERAAPPRKGRPIQADLPELNDVKDAATVMRSLVQATLAGALTPVEAESLTRLIDGYRRAVETAELVARVEKLEAQRGQ